MMLWAHPWKSPLLSILQHITEPVSGCTVLQTHDVVPWMNQPRCSALIHHNTDLSVSVNRVHPSFLLRKCQRHSCALSAKEQVIKQKEINDIHRDIQYMLCTEQSPGHARCCLCSILWHLYKAQTSTTSAKKRNVWTAIQTYGTKKSP